MRTEIVLPGQINSDDRLLIDDEIIRVVLTIPISFVHTRIDYLDESSHRGQFIVGPLDALHRIIEEV